MEKEFAREIDLKEKEIFQIQETLHKALKNFHLLRYVIITNFYNRKQCQIPQTTENTKQTRIHPAVKSLLGKYPKSVQCTDLAVPSTSTDPRFLCNDESLAQTTTDSAVKTKENKQQQANKHDTVSRSEKRKLPDEESRPRKVPRYIPPKSSTPVQTGPSRGNSQKIQKRIIVGNISKWIPPDWREDASSHKWTIYVRNDKDESDNISIFVSKVRFFLHPSYRPNDVVEVTSYPFHLSRRGWGEFPVRVQLHFKNTLNKPVDIIHHLKLDRTYTGLQTLGSETLVDIWIHTIQTHNFEQNNSINESMESSSNNASIKIESSNDSSEFICKQSTIKSIETFQTSSSEEIQIKEERINSEVHKQSNLSLDLIKKLENIKVELESNDVAINIFNNKNKPNLDKINYCIKHDHNYVDRQYFNSNHYSEKEGNITIEHFVENNCIPATNLSVNDHKKEKLDNVQIISHRFNGDIQSSNNYQSLDTSNTVENNSQVNTTFQERNSQENLSSSDTNKSSQAKNSKNSSTSKISGNIMTTDTSMTINGFYKSSDASLDRFTSLQETMRSSNTANSHLKPLQISIPPPNMFTSSTNKNMLVLKDTKSIPVDMTNILSSKSNENSRKLVDGDLKLSIVKDGNIAKLNVRLPQTVSILKKPPNAKINARLEDTVSDNKKPAILILKNTNNLLLNVNENVPILKIADSRDPRYNYSLAEATKGISLTDKQETVMPYVRSEDKTATQRVKITLGKDKYKIQSKKELYEATLRSIDIANIVDTEALIRFIIRRLPIVTRDARDPEYKLMHPYACCSEEEYFAHNIGKQRALEWYRAKTIRHFLRMRKVPSDRLWSVKEIMLWAKLHGYTPSRNSSVMSEAITSDTKKPPDTTTSAAISATCTESIALQKWLQTCQEKSSQSRDTYSEDEEIDVESIEESSCRITIDRRKNGDDRDRDSSIGSTKLIPLELDESLLPFHNFVCDTAQDIGIKIGPEEIVPGVLHNAASRVMMRVRFFFYANCAYFLKMSYKINYVVAVKIF